MRNGGFPDQRTNPQLLQEKKGCRSYGFDEVIFHMPYHATVAEIAALYHLRSIDN